jgi:hypothetical protein
MKHFKEQAFKVSLGNDKLVGYFAKEEDAKRSAKNQQMLGHKARVELVEFDVRLFERYAEYLLAEKEQWQSIAI